MISNNENTYEDYKLNENISRKIHKALYTIRTPKEWLKFFVKLLYRRNEEKILQKLGDEIDDEVIGALKTPSKYVKKLFEYYPAVSYIPSRGEIYINGLLLGYDWMISIRNNKNSWTIEVYNSNVPIIKNYKDEVAVKKHLKNKTKLERRMEIYNSSKNPEISAQKIYTSLSNSQNKVATYNIKKTEVKKLLTLLGKVISKEEKENEVYGPLLQKKYPDYFRYDANRNIIVYIGDEWDSDIRKDEKEKEKGRKRVFKKKIKSIQKRVKKVVKL